MNSDRQADLETLQQARPYLRSALAFVLHLRYNLKGIEGCYSEADKFIEQLEADVRSGE